MTLSRKSVGGPAAPGSARKSDTQTSPTRPTRQAEFAPVRSHALTDVLSALFERAEDDLSEHDLRHLSGLRGEAGCYVRHIARLCTELAGAEEVFASTDSLNSLLSSMAAMAEHANAAEQLALWAEDALQRRIVAARVGSAA
jgi:hypothetical protein